jgi:hypothetical protein
MFVHLPISSTTTLSSTVVSHCEVALEIAMVVLNDFLLQDVDEDAVGITNAVATCLRSRRSSSFRAAASRRYNSNGARLTILAPPYLLLVVLLLAFVPP